MKINNYDGFFVLDVFNKAVFNFDAVFVTFIFIFMQKKSSKNSFF